MMKALSQPGGLWGLAIGAQILVLVLGNYALGFSPPAKIAAQSLAMALSYFALFHSLNLKAQIPVVVLASLALGTVTVLGLRHVFA